MPYNAGSKWATSGVEIGRRIRRINTTWVVDPTQHARARPNCGQFDDRFRVEFLDTSSVKSSVARPVREPAARRPVPTTTHEAYTFMRNPHDERTNTAGGLQGTTVTTGTGATVPPQLTSNSEFSGKKQRYRFIQLLS